MSVTENIRAVIIDDDDGFARTLQIFLEDMGADAKVFTDPQLGLEHVFAVEVDLLLLDLKMPFMDGHQVLQRYREKNKLTSIIIVSATGDVSEAILAMREGADEFIAKPIRDLEELDVVIKRTLEKARMRRELEEYRSHLEDLVKERTGELISANERLTEEVGRRKKAEMIVKKGSVNLITAIENTRKQIAKELHDSVSQRLVFSRMNIELGMKQLQSTNEYFTQALKNLDDISIEIKELVKMLYPISLEKYSLEENIRSLTEAFAKNTGVAVNFYTSGEESMLDKAVKLNLFRVYQESLNNVAKHAKASSVEVSLNFFANSISGKIEDNGVGVAASEQGQLTGTGFFSMKERIGELNGRLTITALENSGTRVAFEIPL